MGYPGDNSLAREIQLRVLSTFKQTLRQADRGQWEEAHLACDFMLRLDPAFEPARALKRRMTDDAVLEIDDLQEISDQSGVDAGRQEIPEAPELLVLDDDTDLNLEEDLLNLDLTSDDEILLDVDPVAGRDATGDATDSTATGSAGEDDFELELDLALADLESEDAEALPDPSDAAQPVLGEPTGAEPGTRERAGLDKEAEQRIVQLLAEGQTAFDREEYQLAIDAWSRIFLIDIDHVEASQLIDGARQLKAEAERELDEILHEGISHLEVGEDAMARDAFHRVLALQPNHLVAKEYLSQLATEPLGLDARTAEQGVAGSPAPATSSKRRPVEAQPVPDRTEEADDEALEDLLLDHPSEAARPARKGPGRSFLYIGTAVLVVLAVGGWYLFDHRDQIFPNSTQEAAAAGTRRIDPIQRARNLHDLDKTDQAIEQLEKLPPEHADYAEAQALIAQYRAPEGGEDEAAADDAAETAVLVASLEAQAYEAYGERRYLKTSLILDRIAETQPLSAELLTLRAEINAQLAPIQSQIELIQQGEWEHALPQLWRLLDEKPDDRDVLKLLVDGYFNLGVRDLQRGHVSEAAAKFREALSLSPDDAEVQRLDTFAQVYQSQPQDLRYRIFIKYIPFR